MSLTSVSPTYAKDDVLETPKKKENEMKGNFLSLKHVSCSYFQCVTCALLLAPCIQISKLFIGSMVQITATCLEGHKRVWSSQPVHCTEHGIMPWGNFLISAPCLYSGSHPSKVFLFLNHLKVPCITEKLYNTIQRVYLIPSVLSTWNLHQKELFKTVENKTLTIGGDARMDSPGHSAKYGSYSIMDLESNKILDVQMIQSNEVGGANLMELEGLKRALAFIEENGVSYDTLISDRHGQVRKFMRTEKKGKKHHFDVFHVAKSIGKKVESIGNKKGNGDILLWVSSIKNHVYWCAASSDRDSELVRAKWLSIIRHIANIHEGHGDLYPACHHEEIDRKWLKEGSKGYKELMDTLTTTRLVNDIMNLSPLEQTSALESYHNIVVHFAPKNTHFFYPSMKARVILAAMHFNENVDKKQAVTKAGERRWQVSYPKYKKDGDVVKPVKTKCTYDYVEQLIETSVQRRLTYQSYRQAEEIVKDTPKATSPLSSAKTKIVKKLAVIKHQSRFAKHKVFIAGNNAPSNKTSNGGEAKRGSDSCKNATKAKCIKQANGKSKWNILESSSSSSRKAALLYKKGGRTKKMSQNAPIQSNNNNLIGKQGVKSNLDKTKTRAKSKQVEKKTEQLKTHRNSDDIEEKEVLKPKKEAEQKDQKRKLPPTESQGFVYKRTRVGPLISSLKEVELDEK